MDTTSEYVKMCEKATEIQALEVAGQNQNFVICPQHGDLFQPDAGTGYSLCGCDKGVWLPRQDELQEMLQPCGFLTFLVDFPKFACKAMRNERITSMEQLWLAFVMKEKFGKVWDGEAWTPIK